MRTSIILAVAFLGNFSLTAQTESKVYIQSRAFHKPNSKYLTQLDAGFGADVNLYNSKKLDLNLAYYQNHFSLTISSFPFIQYCHILD